MKTRAATSRTVAGEYVFIDEWDVEAPQEEVFQALADARTYPQWWSPHLQRGRGRWASRRGLQLTSQVQSEASLHALDDLANHIMRELVATVHLHQQPCHACCLQRRQHRPHGLRPSLLLEGPLRVRGPRPSWRASPAWTKPSPSRSR